MRWLLTFKQTTDYNELAARVTTMGGHPTSDPTPLGEELVVEIEADRDVAERLAHDDSVIEVFPSSDYTLF